MTDLERVAKAVASHKIVSHDLRAAGWLVVDRLDAIMSAHDTLQQARAACDLLNAKAALRALLPPSEAMVEAGYAAVLRSDGALSDAMLEGWAAMLGAILKEGE